VLEHVGEPRVGLHSIRLRKCLINVRLRDTAVMIRKRLDHERSSSLETVYRNLYLISSHAE
jgi:hypothetical protein